MGRILILSVFTLQCFIGSGQNSLPGTYLFDSPPTAIFAQMIYNDTIVCMGVVFKDGDTITYQQGLFVAFVDSCGNLIRIRKYFDPQGRDIFLNQSNKIIRTNDGGYCFVGTVGDLDQLLIKTNSVGDVIFAKEYSVDANFDANFLLTIHEINNSLYAFGFGDNVSPYQDDIIMVKFDKNGNFVNSWRFETPENYEYLNAVFVKDNKFVVGVNQLLLGLPGSFQHFRAKLFEVDTSGNVLWTWVDDNSNFRQGGVAGLNATPDGGWVYCGLYSDTLYFGNYYNRPFVTKLDSSLNHLWSKVIGYPDIDYNSFSDLVIDNDGNYIAAGQYRTGSPDFPATQSAIAAIVTKITPSGEILWTNIAKAFEDSPDNYLRMFTYNVNLLSSGNIIIGGFLYRGLPQYEQNEGWLAKLSPDGAVLDEPDPDCGLVSVHGLPFEQRGIVVYPNPVEKYLHLELPARLYCQALMVYNQMGQVVAQQAVDRASDSIIFDASGLHKGIYFYRLACINGRALGGKFQKL